MELSHNILVIESLSTIPEHNEHIVRFKGEMNATIKFHCSINRNHFRSLMIKSEGKSYSDMEALKQTIQNFFNGDFYSDNRYFDREIKSFACNKIHYIDIQVGEPFKSLFEQIFDMSSWEIPKRELPIGGVS
jgi:hypothetical protein